MMKSFVDMMNNTRNHAPIKTAIACAHDIVVIEAVCDATDEDIIVPVFTGRKDEIVQALKDLKRNPDDYEILNADTDVESCELAVSLVKNGSCKMIMKGLVDTSVILKAALNKEKGLKRDGLLSHVNVFKVPHIDRLWVVSDCAMNIAPTCQDKVSIVRNAVKVANAIGIEMPKVAILCAVEKVNEKMQATLDAKALTDMNKAGEITGCIIDGPLALDNAVSEEAAKHKKIQSEVAGKADVLIVPNIEAGNLLSKSMEYFALCQKSGVIVGAECPIILTSRASDAEAKLYSIALSATMAYRQEKA